MRLGNTFSSPEIQRWLGMHGTRLSMSACRSRVRSLPPPARGEEEVVEEEEEEEEEEEDLVLLPPADDDDIRLRLLGELRDLLERPVGTGTTSSSSSPSSSSSSSSLSSLSSSSSSSSLSSPSSSSARAILTIRRSSRSSRRFSVAEEDRVTFPLPTAPTPTAPSPRWSFSSHMYRSLAFIEPLLRSTQATEGPLRGEGRRESGALG